MAVAGRQIRVVRAASAATLRGSRLKPLLQLLAVATLLLAHSAHATEQWRIDPEPSYGRFRVRLFALMPISGRFDDVSGTVAIDREHATAQVQAVTDARTVAMRSANNARWARSDEFFDAAQHPEIRFDSNPLALAQLARGGEVEGALQIRGVTRAVRFEIAPSNCGSVDTLRCSVEVDGTIRRSEFGMTARRGTLSDRVGLHFSIVAERQ